MIHAPIASAAQVNRFWSEAGPERWWKRDEGFDATIAERFAATHRAATGGLLDRWADGSPDDALALVLVLDQFSRNLHRDDWRAFAADPKCLSLVHVLLARGTDRAMREDIGFFVYLPLMHSEILADQRRCLHEMERLGREENARFARIHLEAIERFGRFPHRNAVLGRVSTQEELDYLAEGGFAG